MCSDHSLAISTPGTYISLIIENVLAAVSGEGKKRGGKKLSVRFKFRATSRSLKPSKKGGGGEEASRQGALNEMSSVFKSLPLVPAVFGFFCRKKSVQSLTQEDFGPTILSRKCQDGLCRHKGGKKKKSRLFAFGTI